MPTARQRSQSGYCGPMGHTVGEQTDGKNSARFSGNCVKRSVSDLFIVFVIWQSSLPVFVGFIMHTG